MRKTFGSMGLAACVQMAGQNLVPNGGFENYSALPTSYAQICYASGWSSPSGYCSLVVGCGSPEFYHTSGSSGAKAPSTYWANVGPHTGGGFAGFAPWYLTSPGFREYVRYALSAPMVIGQAYQVSFWLTNGVSTIHPYGINNLGLAFSTSPLVQSCGAQIAYTPQIVIPGVVHSTTWQYHSYTFTPTAAYQHLCIGNFVPFASTTYQMLGTAGNSGAYYYIDDVVVQPLIPLPVEWLGFEAHVIQGPAVALDWSTATEQGTDHFKVQRSADGTAFETIGTVQAAGSSLATLHYAWIDHAPLTGHGYYRIEQMDLDGGSDISAVRSVFIDRAPPVVNVFPNPSDGAFDIVISSGDEQVVTICDAIGRRVRQIKATGAVRVEGLEAGCYFISVHAGSASTVTVPVVVR